jgi:hypothetical protein
MFELIIYQSMSQSNIYKIQWSVSSVIKRTRYTGKRFSKTLYTLKLLPFSTTRRVWMIFRSCMSLTVREVVRSNTGGVDFGSIFVFLLLF